MTILPSADSATEGAALPSISLLPCCVQTPPLRLNTHAVPALLLSDNPPTTAGLPSAESATDMPWRALPTAPTPTSLLPCCVQTPPAAGEHNAAPAAPR